jgi:hypothetical protein
MEGKPGEIPPRDTEAPVYPLRLLMASPGSAVTPAFIDRPMGETRDQISHSIFIANLIAKTLFLFENGLYDAK